MVSFLQKYREKLNLTNFSPFFIRKVSFFHILTYKDQHKDMQHIFLYQRLDGKAILY